MANFITDGASALPPAKQDSKTPTGSPVEVAAEDMNEIRQALLDVRTAVTGGTLPGVDSTARTAASDANAAAVSASGQAAAAAAAAALKNKTFYQNDAPTVGMIAGDIWFDTNDSYKQYRYNGPGDNPPSQWQSVAYVPTGDPNTAVHTYTGTAADRAAYNSAHPGVLLTGDIWFTSDEQNRAYRWSGGAWVDMHDSGPILSNQIGQIINTAQLLDGSITADKLGVTVKGDGNVAVPWLAANAIGTQHLIANAVTAGKVAAGAITATNLTVANFSNLWPNGGSEIAPPAGASTSVPEWIGRYASGTAYSGAWVRRFTASSGTLDIPCSPGHRFYMEVQARVISGTSASITIQFLDSNSAGLSGTVTASTTSNAWVPLTATTAAAPAGACYVRFLITAAGGTTAEFDSILAQKMVESQLIVDGAVIARTIQAGVIRSDHIASNTITAKNLTLTDFTNLFPNSDGNPASLPITKVATDYAYNDPEFRWSTVVADSPTGYAQRLQPGQVSGDARCEVSLPAGEGESFYMEAKFRLVSGATGNYGIKWYAYNKAGAVLSSGTAIGTDAWAVANVSTPALLAGTVRMQMYVYAEGNRVIDATQIWFRRRATSNLVVDGAITTLKLDAGAVTAAKIAAGSIEANKIVVTDSANLWPNGFSDPTPGTVTWPPTGYDPAQAEWIGITNSVDAYSGGWYRRMQMALNNNTIEYTRRVQAKAGDDFRVEAMARCTAGDSTSIPPTTYVTLRYRDSAGTLLTTTVAPDTSGRVSLTPTSNGGAYWKLTAWAVAPVNTAAVDFVLGTNGGNTVAAPGIAYFDSIYCHRRTAGELIVDGSITTAKLDSSVINIMGGTPETRGTIIGKINATANTLNIEAPNLLIRGSTTFDSLFTPGQVTIDGGKLTASTITANKLSIIPGAASLTEDPYFEDNTAWTVSGGYIVHGASSVPGGGTSYFLSPLGGRGEVYAAKYTPFDAAKQYRVSAYAWNSDAIPRQLYIGVQFVDATGANIPGDGTYWYIAASAVNHASGSATLYSGNFGAGTSRVVPGTAVNMRPLALLNYLGAPLQQAVGALRIDEMVPGSLVVDGSITAAKLSASSVQTSDYDGGVTGKDTANEQTTQGARLRVNSTSTTVGYPAIITSPAGIKIGTKTLSQSWLDGASFAGGRLLSNGTTWTYDFTIGGIIGQAGMRYSNMVGIYIGRPNLKVLVTGNGMKTSGLYANNLIFPTSDYATDSGGYVNFILRPMSAPTATITDLYQSLWYIDFQILIAGSSF